MKAITLQNFRAMQLALKGADTKTTISSLYLEGIDAIPVGDDCDIVEISTELDLVCIRILSTDTTTNIPLHSLSEDIIESVIDTMRAKAVEIADVDVMVNGYGDLTDSKTNKRIR